MLILTRKVQEAIMIGDNVSIRLLSINPITQEIKLGIDAPRDVTILREELLHRKNNQDENRSNR